MRQSLLRFKLPETQRLTTSQFKDLVTKACSANSVVPESFFHYANGRPIPDSQPDFRFVGGRRWVGILSTSGNTQALLAVSGTVSMALSKELATAIPMDLQKPEFGLEESVFPYRYYFRDLVYRKGNTWKGTNEELVTRLVINVLQRERDQRGMDFPGLEVGAVEPRQYASADAQFLKERLAVTVHDCDELGLRLTFADGQTNRYARLLRGSFSMNAKLSGIWQAGNLQSRGYGRLIRIVGGVHDAA